MKKLSAITISAVVVLSLSACTPPIPPEVRDAIMELNVVCETGTVKTYIDPAYTAVVDSLTFSINSDCPDLIVESVELPEEADLIFTQSLPDAYDGVFVPSGFQAVVPVVNSFQFGAVAISPANFEKIFKGEITMWNDPALVADNPNDILPELPISIVPSAAPQNLEVFEAWMSHLVGAEFKTNLVADPNFMVDSLYEVEEGALAFVTAAENLSLGFTQISVRVGEGEAGVAGITPDSIYSATSQMELESSGLGLTGKINPEIKPENFPGSNTAYEPYQAIAPTYLLLGSNPTLATRVLARYALRDATQSELEQVGIYPLHSTTRIEAKALVSEGLPEPEFTQEQLEELGLTE